MGVVLVADDEPMVRQFVCRILSSAGHHYYAAANGLEAVALFRSNSDSIDLVITDMVMPVMSGPKAVARMRETRPEVPVICMTGCSDEAIPPGAYLLRKPFSPKAVLDLVNSVLNQ